MKDKFKPLQEIILLGLIVISYFLFCLPSFRRLLWPWTGCLVGISRSEAGWAGLTTFLRGLLGRFLIFSNSFSTLAWILGRATLFIYICWMTEKIPPVKK